MTKQVFKEGDIVNAINGLHSSQPNKRQKAEVLLTFIHEGVRYYELETVKTGFRGRFDENHVEAL